MATRRRGTRSGGGNFSDETKKKVWEKAAPVPNVDKNKKRKDTCGALIEWAKYGEITNGGTGWEIDHIKPVAKGGTDDLSNLQPLQWENNRHKGDKYPHWDCLVKAK